MLSFQTGICFCGLFLEGFAWLIIWLPPLLRSEVSGAFLCCASLPGTSCSCLPSLLNKVYAASTGSWCSTLPTVSLSVHKHPVRFSRIDQCSKLTCLSGARLVLHLQRRRHDPGVVTNTVSHPPSQFIRILRSSNPAWHLDSVVHLPTTHTLSIFFQLMPNLPWNPASAFVSGPDASGPLLESWMPTVSHTNPQLTTSRPSSFISH
jgi:hypothetical protein